MAKAADPACRGLRRPGRWWQLGASSRSAAFLCPLGSSVGRYCTKYRYIAGQWPLTSVPACPSFAPAPLAGRPWCRHCDSSGGRWSLPCRTVNEVLKWPSRLPHVKQAGNRLELRPPYCTALQSPCSLRCSSIPHCATMLTGLARNSLSTRSSRPLPFLPTPLLPPLPPSQDRYR
jgi:hypothetical protein